MFTSTQLYYRDAEEVEDISLFLLLLLRFVFVYAFVFVLF